MNEYVLHYYLTDYGFIHATKGMLKDVGMGNYEIDLFDPEYMIGIEYDGYGHSFKRDLNKNRLVVDSGIDLFRFREPTSELLNDNKSTNYVLDSSNHFNKSYELAIIELFKCLNDRYHFNLNLDVNLQRDKDKIRESYFESYNPQFDRTGETKLVNCGQVATIIAYRTCDDIDVQFEDSTVVKNATYASFRLRYIQNPNLNRQRYYKGRKNKNNNGQSMTIIKYVNNLNVVVQFDDGYETQCTLAQFTRGTLMNPLYECNKYIGLESISSRTQKMEIINYRSQNDIDVQFEDGTGVYHKTYQAFLDGYVLKKNKVDQRQVTAKDKRIGEKSNAKNGLSMEIIDYRGARDIDIKFEDGVIVTSKRYDHFQSGNIKHPGLRNIQIKDRTGEVVVNKHGISVKIIAYRNNKDIDVLIDNKRIGCNKSYVDFVKGNIL